MDLNSLFGKTAGHGGSRRMLKSSHTISSRLQLLLDIIVVEALLFLLVWLKGDTPVEIYYYPAAIAPVLMWLIYSNSGIHQRSGRPVDRALNLLWAWSKVMGVMIAWTFITKGAEVYSRQVILTWYAVGAMVQIAVHAGTIRLMKTYSVRHMETIPSLIVGNNELAAYLVERINMNPWTAHKIIGVVCDPADGEALLVKGVPRLGGKHELRQLVQEHMIRRVYFALKMETSHELRQLQLELIDLNVDIVWAPDIFSLHMLSPSVREISGVPLYYLSDTPIREGALVAKLLMDKLLSIIALILLSPIMLVAALAVKLSSPGPILYRQERHGLDGKIISVLKFRSMKVHEEKEGEVTQAKKGDLRLTKVGAFLRRTSIDELPQLFNVLQGDMSLVGPRPHAKEHNAFFSDKISAYMSRHRIPPGITGLAQVNGCRGETETLEKMERRVAYDLEYINNWSIWLDISILFKTVLTLFSKNAY
ncbi:MAG TPA: undecaprenyl-phosphate glucose phosphotransferase [Mariprofundaceae bacterium]|nr:undecaprenyl-phosphate glucose phosphotransferase [Mariprofundaceae bacterium]